LQAHAVTFVLSSDEKEFAGQFEHTGAPEKYQLACQLTCVLLWSVVNINRKKGYDASDLYVLDGKVVSDASNRPILSAQDADVHLAM